MGAACKSWGFHFGRRHSRPHHSIHDATACSSGDSLRKEKVHKSSPLDPANPFGEITSAQRALRHPGRHQSERPAEFDRNRWPTSIGMPGRHHRNPQSIPRTHEHSLAARGNAHPRLRAVGDGWPVGRVKSSSLRTTLYKRSGEGVIPYLPGQEKKELRYTTSCTGTVAIGGASIVAPSYE